MGTLKLSPKQLANINQIEAQKQQLTAMLKDLNDKQSMVADLAFEAAGIDISTADQIKLKEGALSYILKADQVKASVEPEKVPAQAV